MTAEVIKEVPQILEHPILVMQSQTVANRITIYGETVDADGTPGSGSYGTETAG